VRLPVIGVRVGLDSIIGFIPGIGDALALAPSLYIVEQARRHGASTGLLARMGLNIGMDALIGAIPLVGGLVDVGWKATLRNVALLRRHVERKTARAGSAGRW